MSMEHEFFGIVESDGAGGLHWSDSVELGDQSVAVDLTAPDESEISDDVLDSAAAIIRSLEALDARARDALVAQLSERKSVTGDYVDEHIDNLGESLLDLLVDNSGDLAIDVLKSLTLLRVAVYADRAGGEDAFAVFDYAIDPDDEDDLLVVSFDDKGDVVDVDSAGAD
jgi:hypothetical protein